MSRSGPATDPLSQTQNVRGSHVPLVPSDSTHTVPLPAIPMAHEVPDVPGYELLGLLGRGGMGVVYKARHRTLNRVVALKMLLAGLHADAVEVARFNFEAQALARIRHPNIVELHEVGWHRSTPFMVLEYVEGGNLAQRLNERAIPARQAAEIIRTLARALDVVHRQGLIHRDLKPSNILLQSDGPGSPLVLKISDFGLARPIGEKQQLTRTGFVVGTPEYMAPEQVVAQSDRVGPATDVYSLGVMFFQLLTGRRPFESAASLDVLQQVRTSEAEAPSRFKKALPRDLDVIALKCLQKEPEKRYASAGELADDLERFLSGRPILARPVSWPERAWKWTKRRPAVAALLAALAVVAIGGFVGVLTQWQRAEERAELERLAHHRADQARDKANRESSRAEDARQKAVAAGEAERRERQRAQAALYAGHITLARHEYERGEIVAARDLLRRHRPGPGQRPEWEWRYLDRLCNGSVVPCDVTSGGWPYQLAFSPDGRHIALASGAAPGEAEPRGQFRGRVVTWNLPSNKLHLELGRGMPTRTGIAYSPDGSRLASTGGDNCVQVWDAQTGQSLFSRHPGALKRTPRQACFGPDNDTILIGLDDADKRPEVWRMTLSTGDFTRQVGHRLIGTALAGRRFAVHPGGDEVLIGETLTARVMHRVRVDGRPCAFSPDGQFIAASNGPYIRVWDVQSGQPVFILSHPSGRVNATVFSPDGLSLAMAGSDSIVRVYDMKRAKFRQYHGHAAGLRSLAFRPDGRMLASIDYEGKVHIWDLSRPQNADQLHYNHAGGGWVMGEMFSAVGYSADGQRVLTSLHQGELHVLDLASTERAGYARMDARGTRGGGVAEQAFSGEGTRLAALARQNRQAVHVWDLKPGAEWQLGAPRVFQEHQGPVQRLALSADGKRLATCVDRQPAHSEVFLWDIDSGRRLHRIVTPRCFNMVLSNDGRCLALASETREIHLLDLLAEKELASPGKADSPVFALAFAPDNRRLAWGGLRDRAVRTWDISTGKDVLDAPLHAPDWLTSVSFSPGAGARLALVGWDGIVQLWDATHGQQLLTLREYVTPRNDNYQHRARALFSPDGSQLIVTLWNGHLAAYDIRPAPQEEAARRMTAWRKRSLDDRLALATDLAQWEAGAALIGSRLEAQIATPLSEESGTTWGRAACLHLLANDVPGYERLWQQLQERHGKSEDDWAVRWRGQLAALGPAEKGKMEERLAAARRRAERFASDAWSHFYLALALGRAGQVEASLEALRQIAVAEAGHDHAIHFGRLARARVLRKQGKTSEAELEVQAVQQWLRGLGEGHRLGDWPLHLRLEYQLLMREATGR